MIQPAPIPFDIEQQNVPSAELEYEVDPTTYPPDESRLNVFIKVSNDTLCNEIETLTKLLILACKELNLHAPHVLNSPKSLQYLRLKDLREWWAECLILEEAEMKFKRAKILAKLSQEEQQILFGGKYPDTGGMGAILKTSNDLSNQ